MSSKSPSERDGRPGRFLAGRVFRRLNVRLTAWFTVVFLLGALLVFALTFWNLYRTMRADDQMTIQSQALAYVIQFRSAATPASGVNLIVNAIEAEGFLRVGTPFFARIATSGNQSIYIRYPLIEWQQEFDLSPLLRGSQPHVGGFILIESENMDYQLEVFGVELSPDLVLQLGYATEERTEMLALFKRSFLFVILILLGVSGIGGYFFVTRTLKPLGALNTAIARIVRTGELHRRLESRRSGDDLDHLVGSFNTMLDRIQASVNSLRDALDAVAHDLRTPMTRFRTMAERALESDDPDLLREALSDSLEESDRILTMLNAMMDISEAESGAMRLKLEAVDLGDLCRSVADVYSMVAEEKGMTIDVAVASGMIVECDPPRMRQVVGNLLDNALKYGLEGSAVAVTGEWSATGAGGRDAVLSVTNRGQGISQDELPRIWERLYRGDHAGSREGLGLGLTMVKAIVTAHGGRVDMESTPGEATTVRFALPG